MAINRNHIICSKLGGAGYFVFCWLFFGECSDIDTPRQYPPDSISSAAAERHKKQYNYDTKNVELAIKRYKATCDLKMPTLVQVLLSVVKEL